jgi:spore coat protein U-like protein
MPSDASTVTGTAAVTFNVTAKCSFGTSTLAFGAYDPIVANKTTALTATGSISINCNSGVAATVSLDSGLNAAHASGTTRALSGGGGYLSYEIYTTAARTTVWNTTNTVPYTGTGSSGTISVYGTIPAAESGATASYSDTVGITVSY